MLAAAWALLVALGALPSPVDASAARVPGSVRRELNRAETLLRRQLARLPADSGVQIVRDSEQVILRVPAGLLFEPDSEQLRRGVQAARLLSVPELLLRRRGRLTARVAVYTDNIGGSTFNQDLAEQRAQAVVSALTAAGIAASRLQADGAGLVAALASNDTPEGRIQNRRIEFVFARR